MARLDRPLYRREPVRPTLSTAIGGRMRALILSSDRFEDSELLKPLQQLWAKGILVDIAAPQKGTITGKHRRRASADLALGAVRAEDYDLLLLPGGEAPARLRNIPEAVAIVTRFLLADKPVAAICHGPQLLIATGLMAGRTATCYRAANWRPQGRTISTVRWSLTASSSRRASRPTFPPSWARSSAP